MKPEEVFVESINMYNEVKKQQFMMWLLIVFSLLINMVNLYLLAKTQGFF